MIVLAALAAYHNSFGVPFLYDDFPSIVDNPSIRRLWLIGKVLSPPAASLSGGRPAVNLSLAVNYSLGGTNVWGYHAFNLAVHALAGLTLYGLVRRTLARPGMRKQFGVSGEWVALAVSLIWTVHPLQTEAVTYISQRCESLMGLFYLLTLYGFVRGVESCRPLRWFTLSATACFLGMASKEVMVTAPVMVLLYDRTFVSGSFREAWTRHRRLYLGLASSWLLLGFLMAGLHRRGVGFDPRVTWWGYAMTECRAIVQYLRLAVWPHPLIFDYGPYMPAGRTAAVAPYVLILAVLATVVLVELKRQPTIGFVGAWFFVILAPTSSVVPIWGSPIAEHRMYLPLASVITLTVVGAVALGKRLLHKQQGVVLGCLVGGSAVGLFTFLTIQRNLDYRSALTIWQDTVKNCPNNPRASYNLGNHLVQLGRVQEAIGHYEWALHIEPNYGEAHYNLAIALDRLGQAQEAVQHYEQALRIKPDFVEAHSNLGITLMRQGKLQEAIAHLEQVVRITPDFALAQYNLGAALFQVGQTQQAMEHFQQALRIDPNYAEAHNNLGAALMAQGNLQEAIGHFERALRIKPDFADAHNNLGVALIRLGRVQEAIRHWEQAVRIRPGFVEAQSNLARARAGE